MMRSFCFLPFVVFPFLTTIAAANTDNITLTDSDIYIEPNTAIPFPLQWDDTTILRQACVRKKFGVINVYAMGVYGNDEVDHAIFVLKMAFSTSRSVMTDALVDAMTPRCQLPACDPGVAVKAFEDVITEALPETGPREGMVFVFDTTTEPFSLVVNNDETFEFSGAGLVEAFVDVYTDENAVCEMKRLNITLSGDDPVVKVEDDDRLPVASLIIIGGVVTGTLTSVAAILFVFWKATCSLQYSHNSSKASATDRTESS